MHRFTSFLVLLLLVGTFGVCTPGLAQDPSAQLDLISTTKGLLPPRMTTTQRDAINSPAEGLVVFNTTDNALNVYNGSQWEAAGASNNNAPVAGAVYDAEGLPYLPVRSRVTGKVWLDRNLGATRVAQSPTDHLAYGDLYQWGRKADGHQKITWTSGTEGTGVASTTTKADTPNHALYIGGAGEWRVTPDDNLWSGEYALNNPCPAGYRLPTQTELSDEVNGWATQDAAGGFASDLKLTLSGYRYHNSSSELSSEGSWGYYSTATTASNFARFLRMGASSANMTNVNRSQASCVRCIKE